MEYLAHFLVIALCYSILAVSLDLQIGHTGLLNLAHAGFFGIGAYTSAIVSVRTDLIFEVGMAAGMGIAALVSALVALISLRLRGDYFLIATFGFQVILFSIFNNWEGVTGGPLGISAIPPPHFIDSQAGPTAFAGVAVILAGFAFFVASMITRSPMGRVLHAIRESESFAASLGKNTLATKVAIVGTSAALAASAGSLYVHYITYVDHTTFTVMDSILIISMVVIGGAGSRWGPPLGAFLLIGTPELLRFLGLPSALAANIRQILFGALLVLLMLWRPRGLLGHYSLRS